MQSDYSLFFLRLSFYGPAGWHILFSVMILPFVNDTSLWVPHSALFRGVRVSNNCTIACVWLFEALVLGDVNIPQNQSSDAEE